MEYTIGSLADLISGKNTPNKPKVVKVEVKQEIKSEEEDAPKSIKKEKKKLKPSVSVLKQEVVSSSDPVKKNQKKKKRKISNSQDDDNIPEKLVVKKKKRKSSTSQDEEQITEGSSIKKQKHKKRKTSLSTVSIEDTESLVEKTSSKTRKNKSNLNGSSLADSDDEENLDEKVSSEQNGQEKETAKKKVKVEHDPEEQERTIFVGNVPIKIKKKKIKQFFKKYGTIETLRIRGIPVADPKIPKKVAAIKNEFHPDRNSVYCYIRFTTKEEAQKALQANGSVFEEHHLRVHNCSTTEKPDESKAIFIGNLSFNAEEEQLWKLFEPCGPISSVRIIRDSYTGMGKGFAYVNFQDSDAVQLALEMENVKLGDRELRIKLSSVNTAKKNKKKDNKRNATRRKMGKERKSGQAQDTEADGKTFKKDKRRMVFNNKGFQGSKVNKDKKKFKVDKGALDKKRKVKKVAPL
ncbi:RNA-binding protein 34 [Diabrotica virgifera virgifera]|uniref:RNA-binding protein 34 n=1 Tax=Diabrotica virgifera virgifera TaxID=50390 RepID=A0A6P7FIT3_DIAVI|nr:RNA-binding protein 34 [Diabrotica virgifera virgifera]